MVNMIRRLYPQEQMDKYLLIDIIVIVAMAYHVFIVHNTFGFGWSFVLYGMFLSSYYVCLWYRDWRLLLSALLGLGILLVFGVFYDPIMLIFAFVQADLIGRSRSKPAIATVMLGIVVMYMITYGWRTGEPFAFADTFLLPIMVIQLIVPIIIHIRERSKSLEHELVTANAKIKRYIQEEERNRIARDLHDTLGQTLTMIKMKSELAARLLDHKPAAAKRELKEVKDASRFALKQVRELVASMKYVSVGAEIEHTQKLLHTAGITLIREETDRLPHEVSDLAETMLALSIREAFTNTIRHSRSRTCTLYMNRKNGTYEVKIVDDGVGMHCGS
jgi:two-component system, NarL family, sensor histidine kinase DesK